MRYSKCCRAYYVFEEDEYYCALKNEQCSSDLCNNCPDFIDNREERERISECSTCKFFGYCNYPYAVKVFPCGRTNNTNCKNKDCKYYVLDCEVWSYEDGGW